MRCEPSGSRPSKSCQRKGLDFPTGKHYLIGKMLTCRKCGHEWFKRQAGRPEKCPKCKTKYWDRAKKAKP